jgi:hypothetical protein
MPSMPTQGGANSFGFGLADALKGGAPGLQNWFKTQMPQWQQQWQQQRQAQKPQFGQFWNQLSSRVPGLPGMPATGGGMAPQPAQGRPAAMPGAGMNLPGIIGGAMPQATAFAAPMQAQATAPTAAPVGRPAATGTAWAPGGANTGTGLLPAKGGWR